MEKMKLPKLDEEKTVSLQLKALDKILSDDTFEAFIKENELTREDIMKNASKFLKVKDDKEKCVNCKGKCNKTPSKMQLNLTIDDNKNIDIAFNICDYYQNVNEIKKAYYNIDFPISWLEYDFKKEILTNDYYNIRKSIIAKLGTILKNDERKGCYLYGDNRIGKSFVLALFSKLYIEAKHLRVGYFDANTLFKDMNDLYFTQKNELNALFDDLGDLDLLILDGFGNEYKSDFVRDNFVLPLLSLRLEKNKLTLASSNFKIDEIVNMYTLNKASAPKARQLKNILNALFDEYNLLGHPYLF